MTSAPTLASPLLDRPGAVPGDGPDAGVARHYGDPLREQRALARGAGLVDRCNRGVLAVPGPDRLSWLHSPHLPAPVTELPTATGTEALVLAPHGHVEHHAVVADAGRHDLAGHRARRRAGAAGLPGLDAVLLRVEPRRRDRRAGGADAWSGRTRPTGAARGRAAGAGRPCAVVAAGRRRVRPPDAWPGDGRRDLLVPRADATVVADRLAAPGRRRPARWAFEALRVEARRPRLGCDTDHRTIPHEVGWIGTAVHLDKGCYRGQETVARVQNLGRPPRRLVLLHLDAGERASCRRPGTPVLRDGRAVGFVGTVVQHHELGPVALAVVKRTVADGTVLDAAGLPAAVDGID